MTDVRSPNPEFDRLQRLEAAKGRGPAAPTAPAPEGQAAPPAPAAPATVSRDTFAQDGQVAGAETADQRAKLFDKYDQDGTAGLSVDEFDKLAAGQAATAALDGPAPTQAELDGAADAFGDALAASMAADPKTPLADRLKRDPALRKASDALNDAANRAALHGDVTAATAAIDRATAKLPLTGEARDAAKAQLAEERAKRAHQTSDAKPTIGTNFNHNPAWDGTYHGPGHDEGLARDLKLDATKRKEWADANNPGLARTIDEAVKGGQQEVRLEIDASQLPHPTIAKAYEAFKGPDGSFPHGSTVADFKQAVETGSPAAFKAALEAAGVDPLALKAELKASLALQDPARAKGEGLPGSPINNFEKLSNQLAYHDITQEQFQTLAAKQKAHPDLKTHVVTDLGPFQDAMGAKTPFDPKAMNPAERKFVEDQVAKARGLAEQARAAGAASVELHNEPNLNHRKHGDFFNPDATPASGAITDVARKYAYLAGLAYDGIKADGAQDPKGNPAMKVNAAGMAFTSEITNPPGAFGEGKKSAAELLPHGTPAQRAAFDAARAEYETYDKLPDGTPDKHHTQGARQKMWDLLHQAEGLHKPPGGGDAIHFMKTMQQAQQEFFGNAQAKTDQMNIHLYGTAQENQDLIRRYGEMAKAGQIPADVVLSEYGSQRANPHEKAEDMYAQVANTLMAFQGNGLTPSSFHSFRWGQYEAWEIDGNPYLKENRINR